jgi:hypothetical protein
MKPSDCLTLFLAPLLMLVGNGCRPQEEIKSYQTEKSPPREVVDVDRLAGQLDRMLAAVVPQGNKAWFFKLVGPLSSIDRHRDEFLQLLGSLQLGAENHPDWQVPAGWQEKPASGIRAATFDIADQSGPLELTVTSLPVSGDWDDYVSNNVNRWLNQLQQAPLKKGDLLKLIKTVPIGNRATAVPREDTTPPAQATWVELVGVMTRKPGAGRMPAGHPPIAPGSQTVDSQATAGPPPASTEVPLTYNQPDDWQPGRASGMRKAVFLVVDGEKRAEVTVIDLPVRGASGISDVAANVKRWAAQVGLQDLDDRQLAELTQPVEIDGIAGQQTALLSPETSDPETRGKGLLAAMIERDGKVWFFKLTGDRSLVEKQQEAFTTFLKSVKFK